MHINYAWCDSIKNKMASFLTLGLRHINAAYLQPVKTRLAFVANDRNYCDRRGFLFKVETVTAFRLLFIYGEME